MSRLASGVRLSYSGNIESGKKENTKLKLALVFRTGAGDVGRSANHVSRALSALVKANPRMNIEVF